MYDPLIHNRKSLRLKGYDYSLPGLYFVTICTHKKKELFGSVIDKKMILSDGGKIANLCWLEIPDHFPMVNLHAFVIMPDHIHGIIEIMDATPHEVAENFPPLHGANVSHVMLSKSNYFEFHELNHISKPGPSSKNLPSVIRGFKIGVTKWFRTNTNIEIVWQRNFWDEIILNKKQYNQITHYIESNPKNWGIDSI
ncbi:MAG: hypothetical protein HYZ14_01810 [Bacteroidetes bacterium]|nr:hypothetical protein [Bacteroidota bacterium]